MSLKEYYGNKSKGWDLWNQLDAWKTQGNPSRII